MPPPWHREPGAPSARARLGDGARLAGLLRGVLCGIERLQELGGLRRERRARRRWRGARAMCGEGLPGGGRAVGEGGPGGAGGGRGHGEGLGVHGVHPLPEARHLCCEVRVGVLQRALVLHRWHLPPGNAGRGRLAAPPRGLLEGSRVGAVLARRGASRAWRGCLGKDRAAPRPVILNRHTRAARPVLRPLSRRAAAVVPREHRGPRLGLGRELFGRHVDEAPQRGVLVLEVLELVQKRLSLELHPRHLLLTGEVLLQR
mmetsp:Transcript_17683/g.42636  ORF Transcript_17683/g.42636 Transcript_17683/m.42636 type:complete len:259 (-) Transcript_17683:1384-2160(-)